jgi:formamidopyrimidine-DNA glycosylase
MPELPEVELFRRRASRGALGRRIRRVEVRATRLLAGVASAKLRRALNDNRLTATRRHGKQLFLRLERGGWLTVHFGMTGALVCFRQAAAEPPYTRVRIDFRDGGALAYTDVRLLGRIGLAPAPAQFIAKHGLGPDALDRRFDLRAFRRLFCGRPASLRGPIKALLMDQSRLAGIGNIYSDEILFRARVHPLTPAAKTTDNQRAAVFRALKRVLETAIDADGSIEGGGARLPRSFLARERHRGGRCPRCGAGVATFKLSGRTGYCCPRCQPRD